VTVGKGGQFERLDQAIKDLLGAKQNDICICLLAGDHQMPDSLIIQGINKERVKIVGCGRGSRLIFAPPPGAIPTLVAAALTSFTLRDVEVFGDNLHIDVQDTQDVTFEGCVLTQEKQTAPFINIGRAKSIRFLKNTVDASLATAVG